MSDTYSTTEQVIGTWTDGKPLYRKVINCTSPSSANSNTSIYTSLDATMVLKKIDGFLEYTSNSQYSLNFYLAADDYISCWRRSATDIGMRVSKSNYANCPVTIIIEYTKTT